MDRLIEFVVFVRASGYNEMMIVKKVTKKKLSESQDASDLRYWLSRPPAERFAALEEIRREYHLWKYKDAQPRLQRVYRIIKL
jgi:hypothetical protein